MAVYRIGDVIRMKREALGITREKLCELSGEVCSVQTLYRIECGKVKIKREVYKTLMRCMNQLPERNYASIVVKNQSSLNLKSEIQTHIFYKEYELAEQKLLQLEKDMVPNYIRNKQYLLEKKATFQFRKQEITAEQYLEKLWEALRYTIPNVDNIDLEDWPYNEEEFEILIQIVHAYRDKKEEKEKLLLKLKKNVERHYMGEKYYISWHTLILAMLSELMCGTNRCKESLNYCKQGIEELKKQRLISYEHNFLYDMVWSIEQEIQQGIRTEKERETCKKLLVQAYYLSIAQKESVYSERIKRLWEKYYFEEIML